MIRIRPGRSWRHNPGYVGALRRLDGARLRRFEGSGILDVLGIEVDGVDIAAGVGEAEILVAMDELCGALSRLRRGSPAAQATVGRGPTELILESRGQDVLLTLVSLAPPARLLASGLLLDADRLRSAALAAARALGDDLLSISPALSGSPLLARLRGPSAAPARPTASRPAPPWPRPVPGRGFVARGVARTVRCEVQVPEESAWRLAGRSEVPDAPLAPLLGAGSLALRVTGAPALFWESPPYLALRDLCRSASALVAAWEGGDPTFPLRFGNSELHCDLTRDEVRASGFPDAVVAPAPALALALAGAARRYATRALALAQDAEELSDLRDAARRIEEHCKDLASGDLRRGRPAIAAAPAPRPPRPRHEPLSRGKVRRLVYRESWRTPPAEPADALTFCGSTVLASSPRGLRALDLASGREIFHSACDTFARAADGDDLFVASRSTLSRFDPVSGERRWQRRMPGSLPALWPVPGGVLRPTQTGIACISDFGEVAFETRLAFTPELCAAGEGVLLLGSRDVSVALDGAGGVLLWRRKTPWGALAVALASGRALVLCADRRGGARLLAFGQRTGKPLWERPLPGHPEASIRIAYECAIVSAAGKVIAARLADGTLRFEKAVPFAGDLRLSCAEDEDPKWTLLVATGQGGACARIGERGKIAWSLPGEGTAPAEGALLSRGVALVMRGAPLLLDGQEGLPLARIGERPARCAALASDASVALCDESGAVSLQRLATHLSVVTT